MRKLKAQIMDEAAVDRCMRRISHEIVEKNHGCEKLVILGIKRRGVPLAEKICRNIESIEGVKIPLYELDINLFRDDLENIYDTSKEQKTQFPFSVTDKTVILVDDVLYTGRTARAAIEAVFSVGRPYSIQLAILIDRGHRQLPIRADYIGKNIPTSRQERVGVCIAPYDETSGVYIFGEDETNGNNSN